MSLLQSARYFNLVPLITLPVHGLCITVPNAPYPPSLPQKLTDLSIGRSLTCSAVCLLHLARYFNLVPLNSVTAIALCSTVQCRSLPVFVTVLCHITVTSHITDTIKAYQSHVCRTCRQTTSTLFHNTCSHFFAPRVPLTRSPFPSRHHTCGLVAPACARITALSTLTLLLLFPYPLPHTAF
jgi:hypothetical protein